MKSAYFGRFFIFLIIMSVSPLCLSGSSVTDVLNFTAQEYLTDTKRNIITARGNVHAQYGADELFADAVEIDMSASEVKAKGNIRLLIPSEDTTLQASAIEYKYKEKTGVIHDAFLRSGFTTFTAERLLKTGAQTYILEQGTITTCQGCEGSAPPWQVRVTRADANLGAYASLTNPVFSVKGIPVLYSPYFIIPIKTERQSGFLLPRFSSSEQSGFGVRGAFFAALSSWHDSTLSLEYFTKRGFKEGLEYRFKLAPDSDGQLEGFFIQDKRFEQQFGLQDRFGIDGGLQLFSPLLERRSDHYFAKVRARFASDDEFVKDFDRDMSGREDAALESNLILGSGWSFGSANMEGIIYENLLTTDPTGNNRFQVQRLPEIRTRLYPLSFLSAPLYFALDQSYTHFATEGPSYIDRNGNELFDQRIDTILRAHRLDIVPELSLPVRLPPYLEIIPAVSYRETDYFPRAGENHFRRSLFQTKVELQSNIGRVFPYEGSAVTQILHIMEPKVAYRYTPFVKQDLLPQFDEIDRLKGRNQFDLGFNQRLFARGEEYPVFYRELIKWKILGGIDIREDVRRQRRILINPKTDVDLYFDAVTLNSQAEYNIYASEFESVSSGLRLVDPWSNSYTTNYSFSRHENKNTINGGANFGFLDFLKFFFRLNYSFDEREFLEKIIGVQYISLQKCWSLDVDLEDKKDRGMGFSVSLNLVFGDSTVPLAKIFQKTQQGELTFFSDEKDKTDNDLND